MNEARQRIPQVTEGIIKSTKDDGIVEGNRNVWRVGSQEARHTGGSAGKASEPRRKTLTASNRVSGRLARHAAWLGLSRSPFSEARGMSQNGIDCHQMEKRRAAARGPHRSPQDTLRGRSGGSGSMTVPLRSSLTPIAWKRTDSESPVRLPR